MTLPSSAAEPSLDPSRVQALLFDLGGVVLGVDFRRVFASWARSAGLDAQEVQRRFRFDEDYNRHERGELEGYAYFERLRQTMGLSLTDEQFHSGWLAIFTGEIDGFAALIDTIPADLPIAVLSNTNALHHAWWRVNDAALMSRLPRQFLSHELGMRKPERRVFEHVANAMGVPVGGVLFFDDAPENVAAARVSGMQAVLVRSNDDVRSALETIRK